jgi:hypothetical protein
MPAAGSVDDRSESVPEPSAKEQTTRHFARWTTAFSIVCLWACSAHTIDREQLSSHFHAIASSAAESELLIDQLLGGRVTETYARSYISYLSESSRNAAQNLREISASPGLDPSLDECRRLTQILLDKVERLRDAVDSPPALNRAKSHFDQIRAEADSARKRL